MEKLGDGEGSMGDASEPYFAKPQEYNHYAELCRGESVKVCMGYKSTRCLPLCCNNIFITGL